jgi:hypothetical protein
VEAPLAGVEGLHARAQAQYTQVLLAEGGDGSGPELAARVGGLLSGWPELAELRICAPRSSAAHHWSQALSGLTAGAWATLDGALLAQR